MGVCTRYELIDLAAVLRLVLFRSTGKVDGETLALAPIMGLEVATLLKEHGEERMKRSGSSCTKCLSRRYSYPARNSAFLVSDGSEIFH